MHVKIFQVMAQTRPSRLNEGSVREALARDPAIEAYTLAHTNIPFVSDISR